MPRYNPEFDYTKVPNGYLRDKELSLKAKGLLTQILSLPEDWNVSIARLAGMNADGQAAMKAAIKELEERGYLSRRQIRNGTKLSSVEYIPFPLAENLPAENQPVENLPAVIPPAENRPSNKELSNKGLSNKYSSIKELSNKAHTVGRGDFKNVILTDEEYEMLRTQIGDDCDEAINHLSKSMAMHNTTYGNHYNTVLAWYEEDKANGRYEKTPVQSKVRSSKEMDMLAELAKAREEMF